MKTQVILQDNIYRNSTLTVATGAPVCACRNNGDNITHQKSGLSNRLLTFCTYEGTNTLV